MNHESSLGTLKNATSLHTKFPYAFPIMKAQYNDSCFAENYPEGPIENESAWFPVTVWQQTGNTPLSAPMRFRSTKPYGATKPHWDQVCWWIIIEIFHEMLWVDFMVYADYANICTFLKTLIFTKTFFDTKILIISQLGVKDLNYGWGNIIHL